MYNFNMLFQQPRIGESILEEIKETKVYKGFKEQYEVLQPTGKGGQLGLLEKVYNAVFEGRNPIPLQDL